MPDRELCSTGWLERHDIIKQKIKQHLAKEGKRDTDIIVAKFLGTSPATYGRWKHNPEMPGIDMILAYVTKLNFSANWLLLGIGDPEISTVNDIDACDINTTGALMEIITDIKRVARLRAFMDAYDITWEAIGEQLSISWQRAKDVLMQDNILPVHYNKLRQLGFPADTLPMPGPRPCNGKKIPRFPGLNPAQS